MAGLGEIPLPADPSRYIGWKLKLTVEKRWRERRGLASRALICKGSGRINRELV